MRPIRSHFFSEGCKIKVSEFFPDSAPAGRVLILPGAGGMWIDGPQMRRVACHFAESGYVASIINYFNRTGTCVAWSDQIMIRHFATWMRAIHDAVDHLASVSGPNPPIGIYGYSLGGFLAVAVASRNRRVGAVIEHAGGTWEKFYDPVAPVPPVLVIHGQKDERVWFGVNTERMRRLMERDGQPFHLLAFEHERHRFSEAAMAQSLDASVEFFQSHLPNQLAASDHSRISR